MNVHQNARLTPHGRERIVRQVESGQTLQAVSVAMRGPWQTILFSAKLVSSDIFWPHFNESMLAFAWALVLAVGFGLAIGFGIALHRLSGDAFVYSIPKVTLYPIILLAFGLGHT